MKKAIYLSLGAVLLLVLVGVAVYFVFGIQIPISDGGYYRYTNIPKGLLYTSPDEDAPGERIAGSECLAENSRVVKLFKSDSRKCPHDSAGLPMTGCGGYSREAIICGDIYFIVEGNLVNGGGTYGPFNLK